MLKIVDYSKDKVIIYGPEIANLMDMLQVIGTTVYDNNPALIVRKDNYDEEKKIK